MALDKKKFITRTLSAVVFATALLSSIFLGYLTFSLLFFVVSIWALHEFYKLMELKQLLPNKIIGFSIGILWYLFSFLLCADELQLIEVSGSALMILLFFSFVLLFISSAVELFRNKEKPFENIAITIFGVIYAVLPFCLFHFIACPNSLALLSFGAKHYESLIVLGLFLLIWSNDTFAYLVGSFIGKHKMYERISPGKTWEGTIGGALLTILFSSFFHQWFGVLALTDWMVIGAIVALFGTIGDLIESMLKRSVGVKDSGNVMPGHGGILDRFDSLIYVLPFVFIFLICR
jgi:phosphatidate cytidylyltransferase